MNFTIFDVGHGFCALAVASNGNCVLIDCGAKTDPQNRPSDFLPARGCTGIEYLVISNFDEDHISDLPRLCSCLPITVLVRNRSISPEQLRRLKLQVGPITPAMETLIALLRDSTSPFNAQPPLPGVVFTAYCNNYPTDFTDTNNLSLVTFMKLGGIKFLIPGDLEAPGWQLLLRQAGFREELKSVNVFIASHHGREGGYVPDVFRYFTPDVIVFSDGPIKFGTQDMTNIYAQHSRGITLNGELRKVLTTRRDGTLTWTFS